MIPAVGRIHASTATTTSGDCDRGGRGADPTQVEALQRVDVADHPAHEIAAPEALELGGGKRLDPRIEACPDLAERPQRQIV